MVDLVGIRKGGALIPGSPYDLEQLDRVPQDKPALIRITFPRSLKHNRWWRALVGVVADGLGMPAGLLHEEVKFKAGLISHIFMSEGRAVSALKSTAFAEMSEDEFTAFTRVGVEILFQHYLPGSDRSAVYEKVREMVGDDDFKDAMEKLK